MAFFLSQDRARARWTQELVRPATQLSALDDAGGRNRLCRRMELLSPLTRQARGLNTTCTNCVTLGKSLRFSEPLCSFVYKSGGITLIPKTCCGDYKACEFPGSVPGSGSVLSDDDQYGPPFLEFGELRGLQIGGRGGPLTSEDLVRGLCTLWDHRSRQGHSSPI